MKLSCLQENLNRGLSLVGRAAAVRTTLPITNNVLLATDEGRLKLVATNLELAVSCWLGAKVEEEGSITLPAKLLTEFVSTLPADKIDMALTPNGKTLNLKCARFEARISGMDAKEFPPIPQIQDGIVAKVDLAALKQAISQVVFAAASSESRPVLTGVNAEFEGKTLTLASADGFRLAVHKLTLTQEVEQKCVVIVPARTMAEVSRLAGDQQDETVEIRVNSRNSQILFKFKDIEIVSQLVMGSFPQYSQLVPQSTDTRVVVDISQFLRATKTASIFARDGSGIVRLIVTPGDDITPGKLSVSASAEEVGEDIGEIDAIVEGDGAKIAFNGKYLTDLLSILKEQQIALEVTTPSSPGVFKPVGSDKYLHVIMPMFVQW